MAQHRPKGPPVHEEEARGLRTLVSLLPKEWVVYTNLDLPTGQRAQTYEHDAIVVAPHGVYAVELKSWGGTITGNRDRWTLADGAVVPSPIPLVLAKARALKGRLLAMRRDFADVWVQGLVFLTAADAVPHISPDFAPFVYTSRNIAEALKDPAWFGHGAHLSANQRSAVVRLLEDGRSTPPPTSILHFQLLQRLSAEDRPYESWLAVPRLTREPRVIHVYDVTGADAAERERARNHALREATLHEKLRGGPDIHGYRSYHVGDDPQRIVLEFEDTTPLVASDLWVRDQNPSLVSRLQVALRAARSLSWVHGRGLVHRRLSPEAVLVSAGSENPEVVRLCAFDLARDLAGTSSTITATSLGDPSFRCSAPEALRTGESTVASDLFSLGATVFELFSGRPLFATTEAVLRPFTLPPLFVGSRPVPAPVQDLLARLLFAKPADRPSNADLVVDVLSRALIELTTPPRQTELEPGTVLRDTYELERRLGRGATATTWLVNHLQTGQKRVLKIAPAVHAPLLQRELEVLDAAQHPNLVRGYNVEPVDGGVLLVLAWVDGVTATEWIGAGDPLDPARFLGLAEGLLGALGALHATGWLHRDVKPDNVMLTEPQARPTLVDVGLAARPDTSENLAVGTVRYKDPLVYNEGKWTPSNDQFSTFCVLYELLTGLHPFGSAGPDSGVEAIIEPEQFPETWPEKTAKKLGDLMTRALSPKREQRPASLSEAIHGLRDVLVPQARSADVPLPKPVIRAIAADATPDLPIAHLSLSARAQGALVRLGVLTIGALGGLDAEMLREMRNVGKKTASELGAWASLIRRRWPDLETSTTATERFYPSLSGDERPIGTVDIALTQNIREVLADRGIRTVGDLARLPAASVLSLPHFTPDRTARVRKRLARLAGREAAWETLDDVAAAFQNDLGERTFDALSLVFGLRDGLLRSYEAAGEALDVSRQRVAQMLDLDALRRPGGVGSTWTRVADELLGPVGLRPLGDFAEAIATRLPSTTWQALPWARFAALLLRPGARVTQAEGLQVVLRPPWTDTALLGVLSTLSEAADWPPIPRRQAEHVAWDAVPEMQEALVRWGADAPALLDALLALAPDLRVDRFGGIYTPPVPLVRALAQLRPLQRVSASADDRVQDALRAWEGVEPGPDVDADLAGAGFQRVSGLWVDPERVEIAREATSPVVDPVIPRQQAGPEAAVVRSLLASADLGGFRVVAMPPGQAHLLGKRLAGWLGEHLGVERARYVDVDRCLTEGMKQADLWKFVPYVESKPGADWRWMGAELKAALEVEVAACRPGLVTVLGQPALLGPLGLMDWLGGFYDRARGGRHGLVVLAIPGGIHDGRVRLNEAYNLPYTPDMAAVYLECAP